MLTTAAAARATLLGAPPRRLIAVADTTGVTRHLTTRRFTDLSQGRVGVLARPGMRRIGWLAADTLRALGCAEDVTGAGRPGEGSWDLVAVWLNSHHIQHLYIQHAWTLPYTVLEQVTTLLEHTSVTLWLVGDTPVTDTYRDILRPWVDDTITGEQFTAAWDDLPEPPEPVLDGVLEPTPWPENVPDDDFTTFRAACRDLLTPAQFTVLDAYFRREVVITRRVVAAMAERGDVTEEHVATWLQDHWETAPSLAQYLTFIRAAQVAFFLTGYYLQVDLDQLIGTAATMPRRALRTPKTWARLHAYPEPHRAAVCALAAAGVPVETIRQLTVADVDPAAGTVRLPDATTVTIEPDAAIYLTAQWHLRRMAGAADNDLLFTTAGNKPLSASALVTVITTARRELGVAVAPARIDRKGTTGDRWLTRWGVSIQELL
jgi:hypothetical protein